MRICALQKFLHSRKSFIFQGFPSLPPAKPLPLRRLHPRRSRSKIRSLEMQKNRFETDFRRSQTGFSFFYFSGPLYFR